MKRFIFFKSRKSMENKFPLVFFVLSLTGLFLIYMSAGKIESRIVGISNIDSSLIGNYVQITGYVESVKFSGNTIFVSLSDGYKSIDVVIFSDLKNALGSDAGKIFAAGSVVSVKGTVDEYQGSLEIVPGKISDIKKLIA